MKKLLSQIDVNNDNAVRLNSLKDSLLNKQTTLINGLNAEVLDALSDGDEISGEMGETAIFEDLLYDGIANINDLLLNLSVLSTGNRSPVPLHLPGNKIKLAEIQIKPFSGDILQWRSFWEQFEVAVHKVISLSDINKFNYLKSLLDGKALQAIDRLTLSSENYCEAVNILNERFGNKQTLISVYMDELIKTPKVSNIHVVNLRCMYDKLDRNSHAEQSR